MEIYLKKKVIENKHISDEGIAVYCALRDLYNKNQKEYYVSINMLAYILCGIPNENKYGRYLLSSIEKGLMDLIDIELITVVKMLNKKEYILDLSSLYFSTEKNYFIIIELDEVRKIMNININKRLDKFKILRYFITLVGSFNQSDNMQEYKGKVGGISIDYLSELSTVSDRSIQDYNNILMDEKLIYVFRFDDFIKINGEVKTITNGYGRYRDKSLVEAFCKEKRVMYGYKNKVSGVEKANKTKSIVMKYNAMCNGKEYSKDEIIEIYNGILKYNEKYQDKQKDMAVFIEYEFLHNESENEIDLDIEIDSE